jgi:hypothetical protein
MLIHPPVVKPCEPPAGIARLAGTLRSHGVTCFVIDANIEGFYYLLDHIRSPTDTWSRRAYKNLDRHLQGFRSPPFYQGMDQYRRAVADIGRLLDLTAKPQKIQLSLSDYRDQQLSPVQSTDLLHSAKEPERNPYFDYYHNQLLPQIFKLKPGIIGISINYLSQGLCAFALIGLLKKIAPSVKIFLGGGLITSWVNRFDDVHYFYEQVSSLVDQVVNGPGEKALLKTAGLSMKTDFSTPDYSDFLNLPYLSPGFILPFSTSDGCWWRRCTFCPEQAEQRVFQPLPAQIALNQLHQLSYQTAPVLIHILDNAISPLMLKALATAPQKAPWYGFVRIATPLDDLDYCRQLAASGCVMLKLGLESGNQSVLKSLGKGVDLSMAAAVFKNLCKVGIATYVYLLFGTPAEDSVKAQDTLDFVVKHHKAITFLNLAIFNLPSNSPTATGLTLHQFYDGDLSLYRNFNHPKGWDRTHVRRFLTKTFKKHPIIQPIIRRDPPIFTSNHAPFFNVQSKKLC